MRMVVNPADVRRLISLFCMNRVSLLFIIDETSREDEKHYRLGEKPA